MHVEAQRCDNPADHALTPGRQPGIFVPGPSADARTPVAGPKGIARKGGGGPLFILAVDRSGRQMYIEFHDGLRDEVKVHRLAKSLAIPYPTALGHLACLWLWTANSAPEDGSLEDFTPEEIAHGALWSGDAAAFLGALQRASLVDKDLVVHNWTQYGVRLLLNNRKAVRRFRKRHGSNITDILQKAPHMKERKRVSTSTSLVVKERDSKGENGFDEVWTEYPKKESKQDAKKAWLQLQPDAKLKQAIIEALRVRKRTEEWLKEGGKFVPLMATWLHKRRWEDELQPSQQAQAFSEPVRKLKESLAHD